MYNFIVSSITSSLSYLLIIIIWLNLNLKIKSNLNNYTINVINLVYNIV